MTHPLHHVVGFDHLGDCRLRIVFADGAERIIDFEPVLWGELYGPLRNPAMFRTVRVDPEFRTLVWDNGADFDPAILHDWLEHKRAWEELAATWRTVSVQPLPA